MRRKHKYLALVILLFLSIGFAILSSNLSIGSSIGISNASFDVHIEDAVIYQTNVSGVSNPVINSERDTVTLDVELDKPGDYVNVTFYVVNAGTIDAQLNEIISTTLTTEEQKYLSYSYQYLSSGTISTGDLLRVGQKKRVLVSYQYKYDVTDFIDIDSKSLSLSLKYIQPNSYDDKVWTYNFENTYQTFKAPHTGNYKIELWGSGGGGAGSYYARGGYTSGIINLSKGDILNVYVGARGKIFNYGSQVYGSTGGAATDVRLLGGTWNNFDSLKSRIMVAGGGGSRGGINAWDSGSPAGGSAGGLIGYRGIEFYSNGNILVEGSLGGTQTSGSFFGNVKSCGGDYFPGGGNGYFTGFCPTFRGSGVQSAGGGSSYISGHNGCVAIEESSTENNITFPTKNGVACDDGTTDITCSYHYSGYKFTNTVMIDGQGYKWTTERGSEVVGMPTYDGTGTMTGNSGNGYAKITYLG